MDDCMREKSIPEYYYNNLLLLYIVSIYIYYVSSDSRFVAQTILCHIIDDERNP